MAIKWYKVKRTNQMLFKRGKTDYYRAAVLRPDTVTMEELVESTQWGSSLSKGDIYGLCVNLARQIKNHILQGDNIYIEGLGIFSTRLRAKAVKSFDDVDNDIIKGVKVGFKQDTVNKAAVKAAGLEEINLNKAKHL